MPDVILIAAGVLQLVLAACAFILLVVSIPMMLANLVRMGWGVRSSTNDDRRLLGNRLNVVFFPELLDSQGLAYRGKLLYWLKRAALGVILAAIAAGLEQVVLA